jgi:hypothetical protein
MLEHGGLPFFVIPERQKLTEFVMNPWWLAKVVL